MQSNRSVRELQRADALPDGAGIVWLKIRRLIHPCNLFSRRYVGYAAFRQEPQEHLRYIRRVNTSHFTASR